MTFIWLEMTCKLPMISAKFILTNVFFFFLGDAMLVFHCAKYLGFFAVSLLTVFLFIAGGSWISMGLLVLTIFYVVGDHMLGDDDSTPEGLPNFWMTLQLWLALPLMGLMMFVSVWSFCESDVLGFGALVASITGIDVLTAREATSWFQHLCGVILTGLMVALIGTNVGHELVHRINDKWSLFIGKCLLAFSLDTSFAIEHVFGHHRYVATSEDPASAKRQSNVYAHIVKSTINGNISAWQIEQRRLAKSGLHPIWDNRFLRGQILSAILIVIAFLMGGWTALGYFLACALTGKAILEIVNYIEHFGIVRELGKPVHPRHSWNSNKRISSWTLFNLTRHSHHHARASVKYQDLKPMADAPMMISGYLTTILLALLPPLWHRLMQPKLDHWDKNYASNAELALIKADS